MRFRTLSSRFWAAATTVEPMEGGQLRDVTRDNLPLP
jgi:hypothetical protein